MSENNENIDTSDTKPDKIDLLKKSINSEVFKYLNNLTSTSTF